MESKLYEQLARLVLPKEILDRFEITSVEVNESLMEMYISLDERMNPYLMESEEYESKGFLDAVSITDFPIRDHKVILKVRRRRWLNRQTGESFVDRISVTEKGTRYSKEFRHMDTSPVSCRTLERFYHVDANTLEKQYKNVLSGYRTWEDLPHADRWLVYPENIGPNLAIDETSVSRGDLYTVVTNRDRHGREQSLVAIVAGTRSDTVIEALEHIPEELLESVEEVTLDLSDSMRKIVRRCFTKAVRVIDRFHIQKLACDAVQEIRIRHRWEAIRETSEAMAEAKKQGKKYEPPCLENGDTKRELLARSRYLLFKSDRGTESKSQGAL